MNSIDTAAELIFGKNGLAATNFNMTPGSNRDVTANDIAEEIAKSLEELKNNCLDIEQ